MKGDQDLWSTDNLYDMLMNTRAGFNILIRLKFNPNYKT